MRLIPLALAALSLSACTNYEQNRRVAFIADAQERCAQIGHRAGTNAFKACTERLYKARSREAVIEDELTRQRLNRFDYCWRREAGFGVGFGYGPRPWGPRPFGYVDDWGC